LENIPTASDALIWALFRTGDDCYRPGIYGAQGPDVCGLNINDAIDFPFTSVTPVVREPEANAATFGLMQEAALYITVSIWAGRLRNNLDGASYSLDSVDFYNSPFYTHCSCYYDNPGPSRRCQIFPQPCDHVETALSWSINTAVMSVSPIQLLASNTGSGSTLATNTTGTIPYRHDVSDPPSSGLTESTSHQQLGEVLLPGDVRFSAQLRILNWLVKHLLHSRRYVLGTLAAMGFDSLCPRRSSFGRKRVHCGNDSRNYVQFEIRRSC
jgi:hypothetical protein